MSNMWRFFTRASVAGVIRSSHQQHSTLLVGSSLLVGGGLLYANHQHSLSLEESSPSPLPSSGYFDFKVLAEQTENLSSSTPAEEAISEAAKNLAAGEANIRAAAAAAHKKEQEEKAKEGTANYIATGEASIRAAAVSAHQQEQEDKAKEATNQHIATGEASIRDAAMSSHKREEEATAKAASIATAEASIRKEAQDAYERENDPRTAPPPQVVLERDEKELKKQAEGAQQGGLDEFEVYKKWKTYLDELAAEQEAQIKDTYDTKVKEMEEFVNKTLYQKVFKEKEILEEKFKEKYRQAIQKLKMKFNEEKTALYEKAVENQRGSDNKYLSKLSEAKQQYLADITRLQKETEEALEKIEHQVSLQHASRVEDQKELMKKYREHTEYQKQLTNRYEEGQTKVALSLAALALVRSAETGQNYNSPLDKMAICAKEDPFLTELVKAIPRGEEGHGVPSLTQLQVHFSKIVDRAFHDTIMGDSGTYWAYVKSRVVGNTLIRKRGLVNGGSMEDSLARGEFYLGEGDLGKCLEELQKVEGPAQVTLACWIHEAKRRQETLLALQAIEAYVRVFLNAPSFDQAEK